MSSDDSSDTRKRAKNDPDDAAGAIRAVSSSFDVRDLGPSTAYFAMVDFEMTQSDVRRARPTYCQTTPTICTDPDHASQEPYELEIDDFDVFIAQFKTLFAEEFCQKTPVVLEGCDPANVFWTPASLLNTDVFVSESGVDEDRMRLICERQVAKAIKRAHDQTQTENSGVNVDVIVYKNIMRPRPVITDNV